MGRFYFLLPLKISPRISPPEKSQGVNGSVLSGKGRALVFDASGAGCGISNRAWALHFGQRTTLIVP